MTPVRFGVRTPVTTVAVAIDDGATIADVKRQVRRGARRSDQLPPPLRARAAVAAPATPHHHARAAQVAAEIKQDARSLTLSRTPKVRVAWLRRGSAARRRPTRPLARGSIPTALRRATRHWPTR